MPSKKVLDAKKSIVANLTDKLNNSCSAVIVDYKGTTVSDDTALRKSLREAEIEYLVVKNTLLRIACKNANCSELNDVLKGTTALAVSSKDYISPFKILYNFSKDHDNFKIKAGLLDGKVVDSKKAEELSKLPSKEVLVSKVLAGFNAPITNFVNVLNGTMRSLVIVLNAVKDKKSA